MSVAPPTVEIALRIPGAWLHPGELIERLPPGYRLTPDKLFMPDGTGIEFAPRPADDQFARVFQTSCRQPVSDEELNIVENYTINACLIGPGGSQESALRMMRAAAAIIEAGGAGVFIDNSALAHGESDWRIMTEDASSDAISFAFVSVIHGEEEAYTMGMHALGYPELIMHHTNLGEDPDQIIELLRYVCSGDRPVGDGHIIADEFGPRYVAQQTPGDDRFAGSVMHNPFGNLRMKSLKDLAQEN